MADSSAEVGPLLTEDDVPLYREASLDEPSPQAEESMGSSASTSVGRVQPVDPHPGARAEVKVSLPPAKPATNPKIEDSASVEVEADGRSEKISAEFKAGGPKDSAQATSNQTGMETAEENRQQEIAVEYGAIEGRVHLLGKDGEQLSAEGTIVTLKPKAEGLIDGSKQASVHLIDMENKTYLPRYITINKDDSVVFVNKDDFKHNVFSTSGSNAFDLGTYGAGLKRAVTLKDSGIVKVYCNIHAEMATFIAVGDQGLTAKTRDDGLYTIADILPGRYELHVWNIRGEKFMDVSVAANETLNQTIDIDTQTFKVEGHKNKFGKSYANNATLFEDEFY